MALAYRQILDDVLAKVVGLPTTTGGVFESVWDAIPADRLPALAVMARRESEPERLSESLDAIAHLERHVLTVEVYSITNSIPDRDRSAGEVADALLVRHEVGRDRQPAGSQFIEDGSGDRVRYVLRQDFRFEYLVSSDAPDQIVNTNY